MAKERRSEALPSERWERQDGESAQAFEGSGYGGRAQSCEGRAEVRQIQGFNGALECALAVGTEGRGVGCRI